MTYKELLNYLNTLTEEELGLDVSVMDYEHEIYKCDAIVDIIDVNMEDVLDSPHPIILF